MELLGILLPVFFIFGIGFVGQKTLGLDPKSLSKVSVYLLSPFLVFRTFYETHFTHTHVYMFIFTFALCFVLIGAAYLVSFIRRYNQCQACGMILASAFMNNGNYGTPVALFAFGAAGLDYAIVLMVAQQLVMCTVGVYFAAKGSPDSDGFRSALRAVVRLPIVYGAFAGLILQKLPFSLSKTMSEAIDLVANATIPMIMIVLGMTLANISIKKLQMEKISLSIAIKLGLSPFIAFLITLALPIDNLLKSIMILMAAMPTAANTTIYALQYGTEPEFVSSATLVSTLLSLVTLPFFLYFMI
ncbi:AEC family transporter [Fictibacillus enclensis]|uniref:AEC family transporter n=1 Tax=Fictibacillus enclensis TaxID=1017270 RepID=UPI0025A12573|nr:AEC family transporter [Fictibacillus enclensis]MDM5201303.1 AEC family transporter [Fictibacillus enclensis]